MTGDGDAAQMIPNVNRRGSERTRSPKAPSTSLSNEIFRDLRTDIVLCRLAPGEKLRVQQMADRFATSLSSVREALSRLSAEGLVVAEPQRGFWVAPIAIADLEDITQARMEIESICIRTSVNRGDSDWEERLRHTHDRLSALLPLDADTKIVTNEWEEAHHAFHEALVANCESVTLKSIRSHLFDRAERYRRLAGKITQREREIVEEHDLIYRAALKRDGVLAAALLANHIRETAAGLIEAYTVRLTPGP